MILKDYTQFLKMSMNNVSQLFFVVFCVFITFVCCLKWIQYE